MTDSEKLDLLLQKFGNMETRFDKVETRLDNIETRLDKVETRLDSMEIRLKNVESDVKAINLTLENEIRTNIQIIAEAHLDLSRNLHEAMKPGKEMEVLAIKVQMLETDVGKIKQQLA